MTQPNHQPPLFAASTMTTKSKYLTKTLYFKKVSPHVNRINLSAATPEQET